MMHVILSYYGAFMNSYQALPKDVEKSFYKEGKVRARILT